MELYEVENKPFNGSDIINICKLIINDLKQNKKVFLCIGFRNEIFVRTGYFITPDNPHELKYFIPEFTFENAIKHANARVGSKDTNFYKITENGWWDGMTPLSIFDKKNRIKFLKWIMSQYKVPPKVK